jgi:hypothetical protein
MDSDLRPVGTSTLVGMSMLVLNLDNESVVARVARS